MTIQEVVNELCKLYRLRDEGKNVEVLIREMEKELCELMGCEDEDDE